MKNLQINDKQAVKIFIISFILLQLLLFSFCFVSCEYAPLIIRLIIILLTIINFLCLFYFTYRFLAWLIKKIKNLS